jgi:glycosyltransferase involved in cell wall biosynthesis
VHVEAFCAPNDFSFSDASRADPSMLAGPFMAEHHALMRLMLRLHDARAFDLVHNHSLHYLPIALAPVLAVPSLTTLHAPPTPWQESAFACLPEAERPAAVTVSESNRRTWSQVLPSCGVVRNGVSTARWTYSDCPEPDLAVWAGRIVPEKGPHLAIDAARAAGMRVRIVGPIRDTAYFDAHVAPRLGPDVCLVGHVSHAELAREYGRASVALSTPRWEEPFGLTIAEALACGTPVASFRRGAAAELVSPAIGRLAPPDDAHALANAAREAASLDRAACRAWVESHLSERAMVERYLAVYRELIGARAQERSAGALAASAA